METKTKKQTKIPNYRHYLGPTSLLLLKEKPVTLVEALDRVLDKGAILDGELIIRIADVDLVFIGFKGIVTSIFRMEKMRGGGGFLKKKTNQKKKKKFKKREYHAGDKRRFKVY